MITEKKRAHDKRGRTDDTEKKKQHKEVELKLLEEETAMRVEEAIRKRVEEALDSEEVKLKIIKKFEDGKKRLFENVIKQLELEKAAALDEARKKEEQARREREELDRMLEENRRKIEEAQRKAALEQKREEEERFREQEAFRQKEEAIRRKKVDDDLLTLGARPEVAFPLGFK